MMCTAGSVNSSGCVGSKVARRAARGGRWSLVFGSKRLSETKIAIWSVAPAAGMAMLLSEIRELGTHAEKLPTVLGIGTLTVVGAGGATPRWTGLQALAPASSAWELAAGPRGPASVFWGPLEVVHAVRRLRRRAAERRIRGGYHGTARACPSCLTADALSRIFRK